MNLSQFRARSVSLSRRVEELFTLAFREDATNVVFVGANSVGKSMLAKNLIHHAVMRGHVARFVSASDMLHDLAAQNADAALARGLRRDTQPRLLCIDQLGYFAYENRYAPDLRAHHPPGGTPRCRGLWRAVTVQVLTFC